MSAENQKNVAFVSTPVEVVCIRVANLRKMDFSDLDEWIDHKDHEYVGRRGRIFIHSPNGSKRRFGYTSSKWHNPFSLKDHTLEESLELYQEHIRETGLVDDLHELQGKVLGCWCKNRDECHAGILADLVNDLE